MLFHYCSWSLRFFALSFNNAIVLEGFRKSLLWCCDTSSETAVWVIGLPRYIVEQAPTYSYAGGNACGLLWNAETWVLWVRSARSRKLARFWRRGGFVLATDQITSPHFSSDSKKNNPGFVSSCHVNPSDLRTPVRTKTDGAAKTGTTGSAAPRGLLQTPTTDLTLNPA